MCVHMMRIIFFGFCGHLITLKVLNVYFGFFMLTVLFSRVPLTKVLCMVRVQLHGEDLRSLA